MKKYDDESELTTHWSVKKLIKNFNESFHFINSDAPFKVNAMYNLDMLKAELMRRGYEIIPQVPKIKKLQ